MRAITTILAVLALAGAAQSQEFKRPRWASGPGGFDTRAQILMARCGSVTIKGHHVQAATCKDAYTGLVISTDTAPQSIQIDHLLPCGDAWHRRTWTAEEFKAFYNDADNLNITRARTNLRKGALLPDQWCPVLRGARIASAVRYERIALRYRLPLSPQERAGLDLWKRGECSRGAKVLGD